jgi:hypothetical protein
MPKPKPDGAPPELLDLMERYVRVAMLLPKPGAIATGECDRAEVEMLLDQLAAIGKRMHDEFGMPDLATLGPRSKSGADVRIKFRLRRRR